MSSGPTNVVMDRGPAGPAPRRVQVDVSPGEKRLLEAASRTPAVLEYLNIQWHMTPTVVKPVAAKVADIGAAALAKLLGTVNYLGQPFCEQVNTTQFRLPDRTSGPASPPLVELPNGLSAAVDGVIEHARAMAQRASRAMEEALQAVRLGEEATERVQELQQEVREMREELEQRRLEATAAQQLADELSAQQLAEAAAAKFVAGAATTEAQAAQQAREEQSYESKKEHQMLERREEALKKAQDALESATVRALVRARLLPTRAPCAWRLSALAHVAPVPSCAVRLAPAHSRALRARGASPRNRHASRRHVPCVLRLCLVGCVRQCAHTHIHMIELSDVLVCGRVARDVIPCRRLVVYETEVARTEFSLCLLRGRKRCASTLRRAPFSRHS